MGLKLASVTWGETEYGIGALPLGGYVKFYGDDNAASVPDMEAAAILISDSTSTANETQTERVK